MIKSNLFLLFLVIIAPIRTIPIAGFAGINLVLGDLLILWVSFTTFIIYYIKIAKPYHRKPILLGDFCNNLFLIMLFGMPIVIWHALNITPDLVSLTLPLGLRYLSSIAFGILVYLNAICLKKFSSSKIIRYIIAVAATDIVLSIIFASAGEYEGARIGSFLGRNGTAFFVPLATCATAFYALFSKKKYRFLYLTLSILFFIFVIIGGSRTPYVGFFTATLFAIGYFNKLAKARGTIDAYLDKIIVFFTFLIFSVGILLLVLALRPSSIIARSLYEISGMFGYFFGNSRNTFFLLPIWTEMIRVILQNPIHILIGTGMNSLYAERNLGYVNDALTAIWQRYNFVNAHNAYLELFAGLGIFSCILYIYLLVLNFKYLRDFSTFELPLNQKYLITALGAYAFGHAAFESLFHPLASGHSNFYIFIFVASSLCAIIDRARLGKIAIT